MFLKTKLREFDERSKHFLLGDQFINSHNQISWQSLDMVGRKLMLVTIDFYFFLSKFKVDPS